MKTWKDPLLQHSLWLIAATGVGHIGNYVYHVICGRMMPEDEYGLMMALFGGVNLLLIPMAAVGVAFTRAVRLSSEANLGRWMLRWAGRLGFGSLILLGVAVLVSPLFKEQELSGRAAPLILAVSIPALNLFLVLTGSGLQGMQSFRDLSLRGSILFTVRALCVGACLSLGFRAAGWAILAHLLGMVMALLFSLWALKRAGWSLQSAGASFPKLEGLDFGAALPVLVSFAVLMSADVVLVRSWLAEDSGAYAQAATLGRMILWLPLPIAQAMFPKVVRETETTSEHRRTALKAVLYTLILVIPAFVACWLGADLALRIVFGASTPEQVTWLRSLAIAMLPLAPLHVWIHYELARGKLIRLLPIVAGAVLYVILAASRHSTPEQIIQALQISTASTLLLCMGGLFAKKQELPGG